MKNKNIHLVPTNKSSRIYLIKETNKLGITSDNPEFTENFGSGTQNQYIYITNNELLKNKDAYILLKNNAICIAEFIDERNIEVLNNLIKTGHVKKIVLTNDPELIQHGIQAIPNEFLEWFVKNPSCEEVDVKYDYVCSNCNEDENNPKYKTCHGNYRTHKIHKIIIPKVISRCCGRCNGFDDLCYADMCCDDHHEYGCEACYSARVTYKYQEEPKQRLEKYSERFDNKDNEIVEGIFKPENWGKRLVKDDPKQETLEEVAKEFFRKFKHTHSPDNYYLALVEFAKWKEKQSDDIEMIYLIQFLSMNVDFNGYGSVSKETARFFLRRYKNSK